ncbi:hypothetical protein [Streptomyces sp. NBC_01104]|uniref:hypothetical protein n=1 Tax=Streptomyces sp. NBC_01104 TaxID=2903750 RepID=UPI00386D5BD0|nr:hypothetical protein OG450_00940 [Streptomyces sp. NBC_01104]
MRLIHRWLAGEVVNNAVDIEMTGRPAHALALALARGRSRSAEQGAERTART